ncbi:uncharacterized protein L3040_000685 [Drepanopeziza brunnea f. sp. 'multigermtubi']|uniref:uncharacterized protein n=1 Tax=Drepanopeziza brunnea f. sp. 'multigermtubi' TaxID=698441 RepID=UPI0023A1E3A7|nr:hypothetical protein L3040_000685 [Drepanopeziza brunnea f. sp. 'multigermtubi']
MEGVRPTTTSLIDREERAVAAVLTHFKNLVALAAEPLPEGAPREVAAAQGMQMDVEMKGLVRAAEDLLQLSRELKELWLFGPLRGLEEGEEEGQMDEDSQKVGEMVEDMLKQAADLTAKKV